MATSLTRGHLVFQVRERSACPSLGLVKKRDMGVDHWGRNLTKYLQITSRQPTTREESRYKFLFNF